MKLIPALCLCCTLAFAEPSPETVVPPPEGIRAPSSMSDFQAPNQIKPPESLQELADKNAAPKKTNRKQILIACYDDMEDTCDAAKERVKSCQPPIDLVSLPTNPSAPDYEKAMIENAVAPNTPLIIIGHGTAAPKLTGRESPAQIDSAIEAQQDYAHQLSTNETVTKHGKKASVRIPKGVYSDDILTSLNALSKKPQVWMVSCLGGMACENKRAICVGAICQKDEIVRSNTAMDGSTKALLDLYCSKDEFNKADRKSLDGILDEDELSDYFCESAAGARPFMEFSPSKRGDVKINADRLKEYVHLYLTRASRPLSEKERDRLFELEEFNSESSRTPITDRAQADIEEDLKLLLEPLRSSNNPRAFKADVIHGHRWVEAPSVFDEKKGIQRLELPVPPDKKGCFFVPSKSRRTTFTHKPVLSGFKLFFQPK